MSRTRLVARLAAGAVVTTVAAVGLTASVITPAYAGSISDVTPPFAFTNSVAQVDFTTSQVFFPSNSTVRIVRSGPTPPSACPEAGCTAGGRTGQTVESGTFFVNETNDAGEPIANIDGDLTYRSDFDLTTEAGALGPANPDTYDFFITSSRPTGTVEDSCFRCFTVLGTGAPTVTSTSIPNVRPGMTISPYTINGTNFTRGTGVEVLFGGAIDPTVRIFAQNLTTSGTLNNDPNPDTATQMTKRLVVQTDAPGGARDLRIFNTDGTSVICSRCLSIDSLLVDAVNPGAVDNRGLKRIAITGSRFQPGAAVSLQRFPTLAGQPEIQGTDTTFVNNFNGTQTISGTFDMVGAAPGSNAWIPKVTNADGGTGSCTCRLSVASLAPTATSVTPSSRTVGTDDGPETLAGTNLARGAAITFSNAGVTAAPGSIQFVSPTRLDFLVDVASNAPTGKVDVTVTNADGQAATCVGCFEVTAAPESPSPTPSPSESPQPPREDEGVYTPINPARILDTRDGTGGVRSPLGSGESRPFQVTGQGGVPADATAVVLNLTAISPSASGFLTAFPTGSTRPNASNINFVRGDVIANLVKVKVGDGGRVSLFNNSGTTNVAADVVGYYSKPAGGSTPSESPTAAPTASASATGSAAPSASASASAAPSASASATESPTTAPSSAGSRYTPVNPQRVLDTRDGNGGETRPIGPGESRTLQITGRASVPADATAVVFNLTAITPTASGFLTAFPAGTVRPTASNINFRNGEVIANLVIVRIGAQGRVSIYNNSGNTHAAADVVGYFSPATAAASYTPVQPARILDTRDGSNSVARPIGHGESRSFRVTSLAGVPANATAVAFNLTAITPTNAGFLTAYPAGSARPLASNINFLRGDVIANLVIVRVGINGQVTLFNNSGNTHAAADVVGFFGTFDPSATPTASPTTASPTATATATPTSTVSATPTTTSSPTTSATATPSGSATAAPTVPVARRSAGSSSSNGLAAVAGFVFLGLVAGFLRRRQPARPARRH